MKVIGIVGIIQCQTSRDFGTCDMTQYTIFLEDDKQDKHQVTVSNTYGDCYSGYTSATWSEMSDVIPMSKHDKVGTLHYVPKKDLDVVIVVADSDYKNKLYDAGVYNVKHNGEVKVLMDVNTKDWIAVSTGEGGDSYYPSGYGCINEKLFNKTPRYSNKRHVYIVQGPSGIGKSHLISMFNKEDYEHVYETDKSPKLPVSLNQYDVIVLGNKHHFTPEQVKTKYKDTTCKFIEVNLSYNEPEPQQES